MGAKLINAQRMEFKLTKPGDHKITVAVVSGGSSGIGLEIVRGIAQHGIKTILTARSVERGQEATRAFKEQGLDVVFHELDVTNMTSVEKLAAWIKQCFGGVDILVNNAGIGGGTSPDKVEDAKAILDTNYYGVKRMNQVMIPLMRRGARIVNVSSVISRLDVLANEAWKQQLSDSEHLTEQAVETFVESYLKDLSSGDEGWMLVPGPNYCISKMALNGYSQVLSKQLRDADVVVNCMCPGHTSTRMTFNTGHSAAQGADTAVWLAVSPASEISTGKFYVNRQDVGFVQMPMFIHGKMIFSLPDYLEYFKTEIVEAITLKLHSNYVKEEYLHQLLVSP